MKGTWAVCALFVGAAMTLCPASSSAQRGKELGVRVGYLNPKDAKSGFAIGASLGAEVDEAVSIGVAADLFRRHYVKTSEVATTEYESGLSETTVQKEVDYNTTILPLLAELLVKMRASRQHAYLLRGSLGYELLWNKEQNFAQGVSETRFYSGFTWQVGGGIMFRLGRRSDMTGEIFYSSAEVSRNRTKTPAGLPVWEQVDLSGIGARVTVTMGLW
ncbi:MAG: porin family protein [candidate division KSB1 bacterium]|nr:porin family protein [candidate division KSB1 bacterium]MDZ7294265.1 porin family protein [candidate division KSB1 bacterium]MDZ7339279.1 porin family protein [candidate division KSB1 bacterium]MDZ7379302.1 porin family protein [candidate division KSB1 bacterium]MDZ7391514.1 porin family protein [candidate division KSB1 bacterium]